MIKPFENRETDETNFCQYCILFIPIISLGGGGIGRQELWCRHLT